MLSYKQFDIREYNWETLINVNSFSQSLHMYRSIYMFKINNNSLCEIIVKLILLSVHPSPNLMWEFQFYVSSLSTTQQCPNLTKVSTKYTILDALILCQ